MKKSTASTKPVKTRKGATADSSSSQASANSRPPRRVLLAVSGSSPAIITETVWALAEETPPVIPDQVVVVTTSNGETALKKQLLEPRPEWGGISVWQSLRQSLLGKNYARDSRLMLDPPVIVSRSDGATGASRLLEDIRTPEDNAAAAEILLTTVRRFSTDPDHQLLGLLSGGRKTMGALLHAALSLAGRPGDRLLHVLVTEPFEHPKLSPAFFFPGQPGESEHRLPGPEAVPIPHHKAMIDLADMPLVALGELVFNRSNQVPATFASFARVATEMVAAVQLETCPIKLEYQRVARVLSINHYRVTLPEGRPDIFMQQLIRDKTAGLPLADRVKLSARWEKKVLYRKPDGTLTGFLDDDISNSQNVLRELLLDEIAVPPTVVNRLFPLRSPVGLDRPGITASLVEG